MLSMIFTMLIFIIVLSAIFGGLCIITGEKNKGNQILVSCMTAMILFMLIMTLFKTGDGRTGVFMSGIPLIEGINRTGSIMNYLTQYTAQFALDFVELVVIVLIISWVSNLYTAENAGFAGKILTRIIIVGISCIAYGFFMDLVRENVVMKWLVYCVECVITGTGILYTPAMILAFICGLKEDNSAVLYIVSKFSETNLGKAVSTAISTSVMLIVFLLVLESQYGSIRDIMNGLIGSLESIGTVIFMLMGMYFMVTSIAKR